MKNVLIVEDKEENLYYLSALLTGHGWTVEIAHHGAEALVKARQNPPDIVISDLLMPIMDGYTLLRHWKADIRLRQIPFIVYTATYTDVEDEKLAINLGADAFILKPAEPEDFIARIDEVQANANSPMPIMPKNPVGDEKLLLKVYSEALIRKLEEKTLQLEQSNLQLQEQASLLDKAQDAIFVRDLQHRITYWNKSSERLYGWSTAEAKEQSILDLIYKNATEFEPAFSQLLSNGEWAGELHHCSKSGQAIIVEGRWTLVRDESGKPKSILCINTDITEKKRLEAQFLRTQRMESIGTLAGGIAHDLNNVLAPILMSLEILHAKVIDAEGTALLHTLESCAQRGADLVRQVLSFARGVEGQRVSVNLRPVAFEIQKIIQETFPKQIELTMQLAPDLWSITGDITQVHQVLMNLSVNARDAMPQGGQLTISMENIVLDEVYAGMNPESKVGSYVVIKVTDTGEGIPIALQGKVFEPFFTTKEFGNGTGLGLSTTSAIVKSHGGFISLYSERDRGTKFLVYLPAESKQSIPDDAAVETNHHPFGAGELILVVDDEESIRGVARQTLERFGYRVLLASNGAEAISLYARHQEEVAVVLTDMAMPVMDGPSTIIALKSINPKVKIIGSSGLVSNRGLTKTVGPGVQYFVPKPYTADVLLRTLQQVLHDPSDA